MTTLTAIRPVDATITCKPWTMYTRGKNRVRVYQDGSVLVWDDVACHYTACHALSQRTCRRIYREVSV